MGAFSFASGFFDRLNSQRDKEEENDLAIQKNMMNVWATTTLPQIRKQRAEDDMALSRANEYMTMDQFQKQPELAFHAAKAIGRGEYKDVGDFLSAYEKDPSTIPPEIRQKQLDSLSKSFAYDVDETTGKVTNFRFKPRGDDSAPIAGSDKKYNSIGDLFMGKRNPANTAQEARAKFKGMMGEDPTSPDAVSSRMNNLPESGTVTIKPVDTRLQRQQDMAYQAALGMLDKSKNASKLLGALNSGGTAAFMAEISKPGSLYTREDLNSMDFQNTMKGTLLKGILDGDFKDSNGAIRAIAEGKLTAKELIPIIKDNLKTPEEKDAVKLDYLKKQGWLNANNEFDVAKILADPKAMEYLAPDPTDRRRLENNFREIVRAKTTDRALQFAQSAGGAASALFQNVGPKLQTADSEQPAPAPGAAPTAQPAPAAAAPAAEAPKADEVPGSFGSDPNYKPPQEEKPVQPMRLGESKADGSVQTSVSLAKAVTDGDTKSIESANPYAVMKTFGYTKNRIKDPEKVVQAIRFSERDQQQIRNQQFIKDYDFDSIAPYMKKYDSLDQAVRDAPVGSAVIVKGRYVFITQDQKRALEK